MSNNNEKEFIKAIDNDNYLLTTILLPTINKEDVLIEASKIGNLKAVKYIVEQGADIHAWSNLALRMASENGHLNIIKYLVDKGTNIHAQDNYALRWASLRGHLNIVKYLVEHGANIYAKNNLALRNASEYGHSEVVKYLKSVIKERENNE